MTSRITRPYPQLRLIFFFIVYFSFFGIAIPFWPIWLESRLLSKEEIGIILSLPAWLKIFSNPALARVADRLNQPRQVLVQLLVFSFLLYLPFLLAEGFYILLLATIFANLGFGAITPIADSLTLRTAAVRQFDYGRVRVWGSLSFIFASYGMGYLLHYVSADWILYGLLLCLLLSAGLATQLPEEPLSHTSTDPRNVRNLLGDRTFLQFVAAGSLIQASHATLYAFGTLHWRAAGLSDVFIGWLWAEGVIIEIVVFVFGRHLFNWFGSSGLLLIGGFAAIVRWGVYGITADPYALLLLQAFHGLTFAATHLAAINFLSRRVPPGLSATAQTLYASMASGLVIAVAFVGAGWLYERYQGVAFLAMAAMAGLGVIFGLALARPGWFLEMAGRFQGKHSSVRTLTKRGSSQQDE